MGCVSPADDDSSSNSDDETRADDDDGLPELPAADGLEPYEEVLNTISWAAPHPDAEALTEFGEMRTNGGGAGLIDLTGDDLPDLVLTSPYAGAQLFINLGVDGWTDPGEVDFAGIWPIYCVSATDLDGDGLRELLLCQAHEVRIYRNMGEGSFRDAGALVDTGEFHPVAVSLSDWDGDGIVDAHVSTQAIHASGTPVLPGEERMLRGLGDFAFEDASHQFGTEEDRGGQPFAVAWLDIDGDADLDLYVVKDRGKRLVPNRLYLNPGPTLPDGAWVEASAEFGLDIAVAGMGAAAGGVDLDGTPEIAFSDNDARLHVYSVDEGIALEVATAWEVDLDPEYQEACWGVDLPDLDNDGDLDLVVACGRREYELHYAQSDNGLWLFNAETGRYEEAGHLLDQERTDSLEAYRGVIAADIDLDGTLELLFTPHVGRASLQVTVPNTNHWLQVKLEGPPGNPDALGSQVSITAAGRERIRVVAMGHTGLSSAVEPIAHFGLGGVDEITVLKVYWPDGTETSIDEPFRPDHRLVIRYGD
jgi:hypothetical protein